ncbi:hypothetical protein MMC25_005620 [Agyrium rufum]|nr:hypothetical protein [Agyrium rufum]
MLSTTHLPYDNLTLASYPAQNPASVLGLRTPHNYLSPALRDPSAGPLNALVATNGVPQFGPLPTLANPANIPYNVQPWHVKIGAASQQHDYKNVVAEKLNITIGRLEKALAESECDISSTSSLTPIGYYPTAGTDQDLSADPREQYKADSRRIREAAKVLLNENKSEYGQRRQPASYSCLNAAESQMMDRAIYDDEQNGISAVQEARLEELKRKRLANLQTPKFGMPKRCKITEEGQDYLDPIAANMLLLRLPDHGSAWKANSPGYNVQNVLARKPHFGLSSMRPGKQPTYIDKTLGHTPKPNHNLHHSTHMKGAYHSRPFTKNPQGMASFSTDTNFTAGNQKPFTFGKASHALTIDHENKPIRQLEIDRSNRTPLFSTNVKNALNQRKTASPKYSPEERRESALRVFSTVADARESLTESHDPPSHHPNASRLSSTYSHRKVASTPRITKSLPRRSSGGSKLKITGGWPDSPSLVDITPPTLKRPTTKRRSSLSSISNLLPIVGTFPETPTSVAKVPQQSTASTNVEPKSVTRKRSYDEFAEGETVQVARDVSLSIPPAEKLDPITQASRLATTVAQITSSVTYVIGRRTIRAIPATFSPLQNHPLRQIRRGTQRIMSKVCQTTVTAYHAGKRRLILSTKWVIPVINGVAAPFAASIRNISSIFRRRAAPADKAPQHSPYRTYSDREAPTTGPQSEQPITNTLGELDSHDTDRLAVEETPILTIRSGQVERTAGNYFEEPTLKGLDGGFSSFLSPQQETSYMSRSGVRNDSPARSRAKVKEDTPQSNTNSDSDAYQDEVEAQIFREMYARSFRRLSTPDIIPLSIKEPETPEDKSIRRIKVESTGAQRQQLAERRKREELLRHQEEERLEAERQAAEKARLIEWERRGKRNGEQVKLVHPISKEWNEKVDHAMQKSNGSNIATSVAGVRIARKDFGTLLPGPNDNPSAWLNDEILLSYLQIVCKEANKQAGVVDGEPPKYHAFNTFLMPNLLSKGPSSVKRWASRFKIGGKKLLDVEYCFIPVHVHGNHWTIMVLSPTRRTIEYFDSFNASGKEYVRCVKEWLETELGADWHEEEWHVWDRAGSARQMNGSDCGVFSVTNAKAVTLGLVPDKVLSQKDMPMMRRRMAAELMHGGYLP